MNSSSSNTARVYRGTARNLALLAAALRRGEVVAVPTETVYGLAANALDARACRRIFRAKGRPAGDPLIVHIHDRRELDQIAHSNDAAVRLSKKFWPGPLTLVLPKREIIPAVVSSGLTSVAVRMPDHPLFRRLLKLSRLPLAAPSANPFGYMSPTTAAHVIEGLGGRIRHVLDGGPSAIGLESTIVDLRNPAKPRLLRPGAISRTQLERALGRPISSPQKPGRAATRAQVAPGLMARHYSPRTPLMLHERIAAKFVAGAGKGDAWLYFAKPRGSISTNVYWLDAKGNARHAAKRLYGTLRKLDAGGFRTLHAELARGGGIAEAINDRLRRAAVR